MSTFLSILPIIIALVLYFTGIPIAYALFAAALTYFGFIDTTTVPYLLMQKFITSTQSFPFLAIPFFIMCGSIMNYGGISARLMDFADALTGHLPGGLAQINVLLSMLMGGCSGSANADAAMECKLLVPEMEKRGYGKGFSAAITAASSCVTPIIPPGINLIVYGLIAGASVGQLFAAGYIPGLLMAVTLMIAVAIISKKRGYAPSRPRRATLGEIGRQALKSFWALFFPLGIIMGMRFGIFTPTEAGGVGVLYCLIVGKFVYKGLRKEHFIPILRETISGTATVMLIIVSATVFGYYAAQRRVELCQQQVPRAAGHEHRAAHRRHVPRGRRGADHPRSAHGADREGRRDRSGALRHRLQRQHHDRRSDPAVRLDDVHLRVHHGLQDAGIYQRVRAVYHCAAHCAAAADVHSGHHDADTESHLLRETIA